MSEYRPSDIRISDSEREDALGKLGEHMSAGRLDIDEYGERSAQVTAAKTRGELLDLFGDLPDPRPTFGKPAPPPDPVPAPPPPVPYGRRVAPVLIPVLAIVLAVGLMVAFKVYFFFLLPFLIFAISSSRWRGPDQRGREEYRRAMRRHRDAVREHHRQMRRHWRDGRY